MGGQFHFGGGSGQQGQCSYEVQEMGRGVTYRARWTTMDTGTASNFRRWSWIRRARPVAWREGARSSAPSAVDVGDAGGGWRSSTMATEKQGCTGEGMWEMAALARSSQGFRMASWVGDRTWGYWGRIGWGRVITKLPSSIFFFENIFLQCQNFFRKNSHNSNILQQLLGIN